MRSKCIVCGSDLLPNPLYVCKNMPAMSQKLPTINNLAEDKPMDFNLCQCSGCGLVQFDCNPVPYYLDSTRAGERCDALIDLRQKQYKHLIETYNLKGKKIIEYGAGKGGFLRTLKEMKHYCISEYGIEYNKEFVKIADEKEGVNVFHGNPENDEIIYDGAPYDAFVTFAYPARLIKPNKMFQSVKKNLADGGIGLVQVPSLEHLLRRGGFYDITADHIAYYSKDTLRFMLQKNGFDILEEGEVGGLYIYAIVKKRVEYDLQRIWSDVSVIADSVKNYVKKIKDEKKKIAVWCAGHFAFTVLSTTNIGKDVSYIIDNASFKQGCYAPASHVKIVGPDYFYKEPVDIIMILGPLYINELIKEVHNRLSASIKIVTVGSSGLLELN